MHTKILKSKGTTQLCYGIQKSDICDHTRIYTKYIDKDLCDMDVYAGGNTKVRVPSKKDIDILKNWIPCDIFTGVFVLTKYSDKGIRTNHVKLVQDKTVSYKCDSRKVLQEINSLHKSILATRKVSSIPTNEGSWHIPTQLLLTAVLTTDLHRSLALLRRFSTKSIIKKLKSSRFKHLYKIIHPKTTFIQTPIEHISREI